MKKCISVLCVAFFVALAVSAVSLAKEAKEKDIKINPKVDFSKLDLKTFTVFEFENAAGEGQDILDTIYDELKMILDRNGMQAQMFKANEIGDQKDEFAMGGSAKSADNGIYASSPTDLVVSGKLIRFDNKVKAGVFTTKKYWTASMEIFVYSKSLNTLVYKANLTRIFEQKSGTSKTARRTIFRSCLEEALNPFLQKAAEPASNPSTD
ncbi:MAG: hypothetical protein WCX65_10610 [bacterium]